MKIIIPLLIIVMFTCAGILLAQSYSLVSVEDIQYQSESTLLNYGDSIGVYHGDTLRVKGVVMVKPLVDVLSDRRRVLAEAGGWSIYITDIEGLQYENFDGVFVLQIDTVGPAQTTFFDFLDTAQVVEFTGVVYEEITTTEFLILTNPVKQVIIRDNLGSRPAPIELTISDFVDDQGNWDPLSEKYEGQYVIIRNAISSDRDTSNGTFRLNDGQGNSMLTYDQSGFFTLRNHRLTGITDYQPPADGSGINFIRGFIRTDDELGAQIVPVYPGDIEIPASVPAISNVRRDAAEVMSNQAVEISATITDFDGSVDSVKLFYRIDSGSYNFVEMLSSGNDNFTGTIPGMASDSALVDYYIWSKDNDGNESTIPSNPTNVQFFYLVLNRNVTIQDVQYNPFGTDVSGYNGYWVTLHGVVTADTTDFPGSGATALRVYMQNMVEPWSGIIIGTTGAMGNDVLKLNKGDDVSITGYIWDVPGAPTFNVTRIDSVTLIVPNSTGNAIPAFQDVETGTIGEGGAGDVEKEQWESVLIKYSNVLVTNQNADSPTNNFGEMLIDDGTGDTRVELEDGDHSYHNLSDSSRMYYVQTGHAFDALSGVLYYSSGDYKLVPRNDDDFVGYTTDVDDEVELHSDYSITQNYPNPFNPTTKIRFTIPTSPLNPSPYQGEGNRERFVTLIVYDVLGNEIATLVNEEKPAGSYEVEFSRGLIHQTLTSGVYFYQLRAGGFIDTKKMLLLK